MVNVVVDGLTVLFSLVFNVVMILVFVFRGQGRTRLEERLGPVSNLLLIPFSALWLFNLLDNSDVGRLITPFPVMIFLGYDRWYRTVAKKKPRHHPENWPVGLHIYLLLYVVGGVVLNGYAFLVALPYGIAVLSSYYGSLIAYGYYQRKYKRLRAEMR
jgi:hypothetical protein